MNLGVDFFKIFNLVIQIIRLIVQMFGDEEAQKEVAKSKERTADSDPNHAC